MENAVHALTILCENGSRQPIGALEGRRKGVKKGGTGTKKGGSKKKVKKGNNGHE